MHSRHILVYFAIELRPSRTAVYLNSSHVDMRRSGEQQLLALVNSSSSAADLRTLAEYAVARREVPTQRALASSLQRRRRCGLVVVATPRRQSQSPEPTGTQEARQHTATAP